MSGPHPAVALLRRAVRDVLPDCRDTVLVACSGGPDSLALAAAVAFEAPRAGRRAGLVVVDHGLQDGSADVAAGVATLAGELGLDPVHAVAVTLGADGGPENAARSARYSALDDAAEAHDADVLLGHTLDDQAETVLLGLGRGSGLRSVAGMAGRTRRYVRPLLRVRRADTVAACAALGLPVWDDPHNADPRFRRARLRHEVLPLLEDVLGGGAAEALARTAAQARADADALDVWSAEAYDALINSSEPSSERGLPAVDQAGTRPPALDVAALAELPEAVRTRVLRSWARDAGAQPLTAERTAALDALVCAWRGQAAVELPGGVSVRRVDARLVVVTTPGAEQGRAQP